MTFDDVLVRFKATPNGDGYKAHCPVHKDDKQSLTIGFKDGKILLHCHAGCDTHAILDAVGLTFKDLFLNNDSRSPVVASYLYRDLEGEVRYRKTRTADKQFFFAKPDGHGGWITNKSQNGGKPVLDGVSRLPYRIDELVGHTQVFIVEGEKDADRLWSHGLPATTNDAGASDDLHKPKWTDALTQQLKAIGITSVICLPDNDGPGHAHMQAVARSCVATAIEARIAPLPGLSAKGDVSDYLDAGHTIDELMALVTATSPVEVQIPNSLVEDLPTFLARLGRAPEPDWLIPGLIPDAGITLWHGQPRDFKTMCALEVGLALADGRTAFNNDRFKATRAVVVAYFSEEDPEPLVAARLRWLTAKTGVPRNFYPFIRKSLSFDVPDDQLYILHRIKECGAHVSFFDPVRSFTGLSDKGPADLRPVTVFLRRIQNDTTSKVVSLIHHDTKPPAVATDNPTRSRSQQASGGGIFSISDCPVSFTKLTWNTVAVYPEDYKLSGNPKPFEVTFETDERDGGEHGPRFGSWIRPVAVTRVERDIVDGAAGKKILNFLHANVGEWFTSPQIDKGAHLRNDTAASVLKRLLEDGSVRLATGKEAKALGRSANAHLWSAASDAVEQAPFGYDHEL